MQRLEVSGAVRPIYGSLGVRRLKNLYKLADSVGVCLAHRCNRRFGEQKNCCKNFSCFVGVLLSLSFL